MHKKKIDKIIIYGEHWCPFCKKAKEIAKKISKSTQFKTGLTSKQIQAKLKLQNTPRTIPQINVNGKHIGGYSNLLKLL